MNIDTIRIGNINNSTLILIINLSYSKIKLIPNIKKIINEYFIDDIEYIYVTNQEELANNGNTLKFSKDF